VVRLRDDGARVCVADQHGTAPSRSAPAGTRGATLAGSARKGCADQPDDAACAADGTTARPQASTPEASDHRRQPLRLGRQASAATSEAVIEVRPTAESDRMGG
jgi:hypothetical protein